MEENNPNEKKMSIEEINEKEISPIKEDQQSEIKETEKDESENEKSVKEKEIVQESKIEENLENEGNNKKDEKSDQVVIDDVCKDVLNEVIQKVENNEKLEKEENLETFENQKKEKNLEIEVVEEKEGFAEKKEKMEIEEKIEIPKNDLEIQKPENEDQNIQIEKNNLVQVVKDPSPLKDLPISENPKEETNMQTNVEKKMETNIETKMETNMEIEKIPEENQNRVFCFGNAESDQFKIPGDNIYEIKKPIEIPYFLTQRQKIVKIACGSQHSVILNENGEVFTFGNNDSGALGRETEIGTTPAKVDLDGNKVNLVSAGESHTFLANSLTGTTVFFGKLKSYEKTLIKKKEPLICDNYKLKKGISKVLSGNNHILILSHGRIYVFGDESFGALGIVNKRRPKSFVDFDDPQTLPFRGVKNIFVGGNSSFFLSKKNKICAFGLNNYKQLGFESDTGVTFENEPIEWNQIKGEDILEITGGEHHTLILFKNGDIYGAGKNDDGQLGNFSEDSPNLGSFKKLGHLPKISEIFASSHFSYALDQNKDNFYTWGFGYAWVLGNGKEDSVSEAWRIKNDKVFKGFFPDRLALGTSFVAYVTQCTGDREVLLGNCKRTVRKRRYKKKDANLRKKKKLKTLD